MNFTYYKADAVPVHVYGGKFGSRHAANAWARLVMGAVLVHFEVKQ